jgi:hypothetical protein
MAKRVLAGAVVALVVKTPGKSVSQIKSPLVSTFLTGEFIARHQQRRLYRCRLTSAL